MTDTTTYTGNGTAGAPRAAKRKIASATVSGSTVELRFSKEFGDRVIKLDTAKVPADCRNALSAQGAVSVIQTSYSNADDPVAAAEDVVNRLLAGDWRPGPPRGLAPSDPLLQAIAEHLSHESKKVVSMEHVEKNFLPSYQKHYNLANVAAARRKLRGHPDVAARVAQIEAARAKLAADKVKGVAHESLLNI